jgi:hypothetical protein
MLLILRFFSTVKARQNPPHSANRGRGATGDRFQIERVERLEKSWIGAANVKSQRSERSQEVVENKGKCFSHTLQSQEVSENKGVIFVKPRGC